jgi:hypothetical protein
MAISNCNLPSYLTYLNASASINLPSGGSAGSTYLFYNQSNCSIEAIRL